MKPQTSIITLRHLIIENNKYIGIDFVFNKKIHSCLQSFKTVKWSDKYNMYYVLNTKKELSNIFVSFKGIAWINCRYFFKDKPVNTAIEQPDFSELKKNNSKKKKCPDEYIVFERKIHFSKK